MTISQLAKVASKHCQAKDVIKIYGKSVSWTPAQIQEAVKTYKKDFGKFCKDKGLVSSDVEKLMMDYILQYQEKGSLIKLGSKDLKVPAETVKTWLDKFVETRDVTTVFPLFPVASKETAELTESKTLESTSDTKPLVVKDSTYSSEATGNTLNVKNDAEVTINNLTSVNVDVNITKKTSVNPDVELKDVSVTNASFSVTGDEVSLDETNILDKE